VGSVRGGPSSGSTGSGGPGGGGGYNFQATATAFVYAHVLAGQPLSFAAQRYPVPLAVWAESGGPGDDLRVECQDGAVVEIQTKRGLSVGEDFWKAVKRLVDGLVDHPELFGVLLVDSTASNPVRTDFRRGVRRLADGRTNNLDRVTKTFQTKLEGAGVTDLSVLKRLAVEVRDFDEGSDGRENALLMLRGVAEDPLAAGRAFDADAHSLIENRGRRTAEDLALLLSAQGGGISTRASQPAAIAQEYRDWLTDVTSRFRVPGAAVSLPIGEAWARIDGRERPGALDHEGTEEPQLVQEALLLSIARRRQPVLSPETRAPADYSTGTALGRLTGRHRCSSSPRLGLRSPRDLPAQGTPKRRVPTLRVPAPAGPMPKAPMRRAPRPRLAETRKQRPTRRKARRRRVRTHHRRVPEKACSGRRPSRRLLLGSPRALPVRRRHRSHPWW
jgi:hypothetical protein